VGRRRDEDTVDSNPRGKKRGRPRKGRKKDYRGTRETKKRERYKKKKEVSKDISMWPDGGGGGVGGG